MAAYSGSNVAQRESVALLVYSEARRQHFIVTSLASRLVSATNAWIAQIEHARSPEFVSSCACSPTAQLVRIEPQSGDLQFSHAVGRDVFDSEVREGRGWRARLLRVPACHAGMHAR